MLAAAHNWRSLVVPALPVEGKTDTAHAHTAPDAERPATHRCRYRPWAELMKRTFALDVEHCERCGARLRLRALVTAAASIERFLRYIAEPTEPPPLAPARGPPYFSSRVLRRRLGDLDSEAGGQAPLFSV